MPQVLVEFCSTVVKPYCGTDQIDFAKKIGKALDPNQNENTKIVPLIDKLHFFEISNSKK